MKPKVSSCVPNLNTRPFLPERFETIFSQSFQDWELLVYDGYSEDGAWEYIQELAANKKNVPGKVRVKGRSAVGIRASVRRTASLKLSPVADSR